METVARIRTRVADGKRIRATARELWISRNTVRKALEQGEAGFVRRKRKQRSSIFGFKEQFTFMAFIHLSARRSMRDGVRCLAALSRRLYHWGLKSVARSTVADANNSRPVAFFMDLFAEMYQLCRPVAPKHKFRFKSKLFSLDASTISLCLSLFPWATFRHNKAGVKMHTLLDHDGYIPAFVALTEAKLMKAVWFLR